MTTISLNLSDPSSYAIITGLLATCVVSFQIGASSNTTPTIDARRRLKAIRVAEKEGLLSGQSSDAKKLLSLGELDVRRKCQIAKGGPTDHSGEVVVSAVPGFDLDTTIFGSISGALPRTVQKSKIAIELFWSDSAVSRVDKMYEIVPSPPSYKKGLMDFMQHECDFAIEHADGSFMDHLKFCHDYSVYNAPGISPTPLFLHSIMGVGTNFFPMTVDLIPKLKTLVTELEYKQIEAFPSVLRLVLGTNLLDDLEKNVHRLDSLQSVSFRRVIDNEPLTLKSDEFFQQLNYQLMHTLDFLPAASWLNQMDDGFMNAFISLHFILSDSKKMVCKVDYHAGSGEKTKDGIPVTVGSILRGIVPDAIIKTLARKAICKFSNAIGHDLQYEIVWA